MGFPFTRRLLPALTSLAVVVAPAAARADAAPPLPQKIKIAVLDVRATGPIDPKQVEGLSSLLVAEASRDPRLQVTGSQDIRTVVGFEAERQLLACNDSGCLAELGGALGVSYLVSTEVSKIGSVWVVTTTLMDMAAAQAIHRTSRRVPSENDLLDAAVAAQREALSAIPGLRPLSAPPVAERSGGGWLKWTLGGTGGAALLAGGVLYGLAFSTASSWNARDPAITPAQAYTARDVYQPLGMGLMIGGAALAVGALLLPSPEEAPAVALTVDPRSGTAYATLTLRLE